MRGLGADQAGWILSVDSFNNQVYQVYSLNQVYRVLLFVYCVLLEPGIVV